MTQHEIERQIKRINERIADIVREFGKDSKIYRDYESRINQIFNEKQFFYGSGDRVALSHGKKILNDDKIKEKLSKLDKLPTKGEMLKRAKQSIIEEKGKKYKPTKTEIKQRSIKLQEFNDFFEEHKEEFYKLQSDSIDNALDIMHQSHKTYTDLDKVVQAYYEDIETDRAQLKNWVEEIERS